MKVQMISATHGIIPFCSKHNLRFETHVGDATTDK